MDPVWYTVNYQKMCFSRRQTVFIVAKIAFTICDTQIPSKFTYSIIILARRGKYKKYQKISENYESSGHNLDTIMAQFFPSQKEILASFIVTILYTFGHSIVKKTAPISRSGSICAVSKFIPWHRTV